MKAASYFGLGLLFAIGLGLSGMTQPHKVLGFLDVAGAWDPTLMFVMGAAVVVTAIGFRLQQQPAKPLLASGFQLPTRRDIDPGLVTGAVLFGVGWGMAGFCPGPALVAAASGTTDVLLFVAAMFAGFAIRDYSPLPRQSLSH